MWVYVFIFDLGPSGPDTCMPTCENCAPLRIRNEITITFTAKFLVLTISPYDRMENLLTPSNDWKYAKLILTYYINSIPDRGIGGETYVYVKLVTTSLSVTRNGSRIRKRFDKLQWNPKISYRLWVSIIVYDLLFFIFKNIYDWLPAVESGKRSNPEIGWCFAATWH